MDISFEKNTFAKRLSTMVKVDVRRMFTSRFFYIVVAACLVAPILILVMTTLMDGTVTVDPETGVETVTEGFDNVWQIIGSLSTDNLMGGGISAEGGADAAAGAMSLTSMCNINMLYFAMAALVCIFISNDFRSGYSKNLFTVRAKKSDYVISKTFVCFLGCTAMLAAFFVGSMIGGAICNSMFDLPFAMEGFGVFELVLCLLSKVALALVFVPIYVCVSVVAKQRAWLSIILSAAVGMLLFMMIPMLTPLDQTPMNLGLCAAGGAIFSLALGSISSLILKKTSLV